MQIRREQNGAAFVNAVEQIVEMVNPHGAPIPCTPALRPMNAEAIHKRLSCCVALGLTRFARRPEAQTLLADREAFLVRCEGMYRFDAGWENASLGEGDAMVVARGKVRARTGAMHPIYPEVRAAWLDQVRFCIERGVDGVNFRAANHNQVYEPRFYGFNPPVVERMTHPGNFAEAERINGDAYTKFLREAAALLHDAGREIGVHVHGLMLRYADRAPNINMVPLNFEWQWETWFKEFADYAEYRGAFFFRPENQRYVADRIGFAARAAGIPLAYQSLRGGMVHFDGPHHSLAHEMDWVRSHPDVAAYNLYEMACFSRCNPETGFEGSRDMAELVRKHWHEKGENI
ncbi:MAG: hypothetical protein LC725_08465 [Lentisphaerae bacterium]|nr:hypothetical protein [Lentisphaerota bacterium]